MAGGGEAEDNPVHMNVVAMVDIIFCLCVFFMCSFKFKQLEGAFKSWLPKDKGSQAAPSSEPKEIRVAIEWDKASSSVIRKFLFRPIPPGDAGTAELEQLIRGSQEDWTRKGNPDVPLIIDAGADVPWEEVMTLVNIAQKLSLKNVEFALGASQLATAKKP